MSSNSKFIDNFNDVYVYQTDEYNEQLNRAIEKAKNTIQYFKESLSNPKPVQTAFSIKAKLIEGNISEHIWLDAKEIVDKVVYGIINNIPLNLKNVELGKRIGFSEDQISDWLIIENNRLVGGYTLRAIYEQMNRSEQDSFNSTINFKIDHGVDYFEASNKTPEGAIILLENAYDNKDLEAVYDLIDFEDEAKRMISKRMPERVESEEMVNELMNLFKLTLEKWKEDDNWPSFKNVERAFIEKELIAEGLFVVTEYLTLHGSHYATNRIYVKRQPDNTYKAAGSA